MSQMVSARNPGAHNTIERRILVINSNTSASITEHVQRIAEQRVRPGTGVQAITAAFGPASIESRTDGLVAAAATVELIARYATEYDGFVIACYSDPGLQAAREVTDRPVVGIAEASMFSACLLGDRFSVVSPLRRLRPVIRDLALRYGVAARLASVRTFEMPVLDVARHPQEAASQLLLAGRAAVDEDGADVLCLGGVVLAGGESDLGRALGVPVLDGLSCALQLVEGLIAQRLRTSRVYAIRPSSGKRAKNLPAALGRLYGGAHVESHEESDKKW